MRTTLDVVLPSLIDGHKRAFRQQSLTHDTTQDNGIQFRWCRRSNTTTHLNVGSGNYLPAILFRLSAAVRPITCLIQCLCVLQALQGAAGHCRTPGRAWGGFMGLAILGGHESGVGRLNRSCFFSKDDGRTAENPAPGPAASCA